MSNKTKFKDQSGKPICIGDRLAYNPDDNAKYVVRRDEQSGEPYIISPLLPENSDAGVYLEQKTGDDWVTLRNLYICG